MKELYYYKTKGMFWFRINGSGIILKDTRLYPLLFSERNGYVKVLIIGKWAIKFLKPHNR